MMCDANISNISNVGKTMPSAPSPSYHHFYRWYVYVCLKMGYTPNYSHLVGIMIINHWVIGYTIFRQTHVYVCLPFPVMGGLWPTRPCPSSSPCRAVRNMPKGLLWGLGRVPDSRMRSLVQCPMILDVSD